jgi:hypothetical protein
MPIAKRLDRVEISETEISEYDGHRKVVTISKDDVKEISIEYGFSEERPITSILIGLIILAPGVSLGLLPLFQILSRLLRGEQVHGNIGLYAFATPLIFIGAGLLFKTFKLSYFLKIVTNKSIKKLPFRKNIERAKIDLFAMECNKVFGYKIKNSSR